MAGLDQVDALGDTDAWLDGIAPSKIADLAGEADAQDADILSRCEAVKQVALLACLTHIARMRARDDLAEMLCKRMPPTSNGPRRSWRRSAPASARPASG